MRFYERREVRDMIAYLRVLANPDDTVSLRRVLNVPKRGIGDRAEAVVATHAERERISFAAALRDAAEDKVPLLNPRSVKAIERVRRDARRAGRLIADGAEVHDVLEAVLEKTGYRVELEESDDPQDHTRVENLDELVTVAREFTEITAEVVADENAELVVEPGVPAPGSLPAFLERVSLVADADSVPSPDGGEEGDGGAGVVTLMTVHTAKGLEYPVVFCTGWEDGVFPHMRALGDPTELAEERRLAYVAITRARQRLYVSRAITRSAWGQPSMNPASRFLDELPGDLVDWRRLEPSSGGFGSLRRRFPRYSAGGDHVGRQAVRVVDFVRRHAVVRQGVEGHGGAEAGRRRPRQPRQVRPGHGDLVRRRRAPAPRRRSTSARRARSA